jgi:hypothetical protein
MDWNRAIALNHAALARILAEVVALLGWSAGASLGRVPRPVYVEALRILRPAEAALRRLIVIAARGLAVTLAPPRPMPKGLVIAGNGTGVPSFQLYDQRKVLGPPRLRYTKAKPRVHFFGAHPLVPSFAPPPAFPDDSISAASLSRRLAAALEALASLPRQAVRLARWRARRARMEKAKFTEPLRPGRPPGHRSKGQDDADLVLRECHALAHDALRADSS